MRPATLPNLIAGGLASNRSRLVAVLVPEVAQSIFNDTIEAMSTELALDGNIVMLGLTGADNSRMRPLIDAALARRADGIILTGIVTDAETRERLRQRDITVIETWGIPEDPIDIAVGFSHLAVGRDIARFLLGRGYTQPLGDRSQWCPCKAAPRWIHRRVAQLRPPCARCPRRTDADAFRTCAAGLASCRAAQAQRRRARLRFGCAGPGCHHRSAGRGEHVCQTRLR